MQKLRRIQVISMVRKCSILGLKIAAIFSTAFVITYTFQKNSWFNVSGSIAQITVIDGNLFEITQSKNRQLTYTNEVETLFSKQGGTLLVGKGIQIPTYSDQPQYTTLYLLRDNGSVIRKVTDREVEYGLLSPTGDWIFYLAANGEIFKQDIKTGQEEQITNFATPFSISPDGHHLAFLKLPSNWQPGELGWTTEGITILDTTTGEERLLVPDELAYEAHWTPDGEYLLISSGTSYGEGAIFLIDRDGSNRTQLTATSSWYYYDNETIPSISSKNVISADGRFIIYEADLSIWMLELDMLKRTLVQAKRIAYGRNPQWVEDGKTFSIQASDRVLLLMDMTGKVIY